MTYAFARALTALVLIAAQVDAQSLGNPVPNGYAEYLVLLRTPAGALPPLSTASILGVVQRSLQVAARYGYVPDITHPLAEGTAGHEARSLNSFGLTALGAVGLAGTVSLTAGVSNQRCDGCRAQFMAAAGADYRFFASALSDPQSWRFSLGAQGEVGFGTPEQGSAWSAKLGVPVTVTIGAWQGTRIIPFVVPALAVVWASGLAEGSGALFSAGGGVTLYNPKSPLGASIGFQYMSVSASELELGVAISIGGR